MSGVDSPKSAEQVPFSFVASVSHELRGPLHAIMGLSELLAERDIRQQDKRLVKALQTEAATLKVLIDDLLDYARMSDSGLELESQVFSPKQLVASLVESARPIVTNKGLSLEFTADPDVPAFVTGDPVRYGQVLRNLLNNAAKFTSQGSIKVHLSLEERRIRCCVTDTGHGIDSEQVADIFTPFKQLHGTQRGAGLGLAICSEIAQLMGGAIEVESQPSQGSKFCFSAELDAHAAPQESIAQVERRKTTTILVVEDNEVNQLLAEQQLKLLGYRAEIVATGELAVEAADPHYGAILMDWNLPGIDGLEATRRIRAKGTDLAELPIIAMTANAMGSDADECFAAGMNGFLAKPVSVAALKTELERVLAISIPVSNESNASENSALAKLEAELGDRAIVEQLVQTFLTELAIHIKNIQNCTEDSFEIARRSAHTLGSTAALLGSASLAEQCRAFSKLHPWTDKVREAASEITATAEASELTLQKYLS